MNLTNSSVGSFSWSVNCFFIRFVYFNSDAVLNIVSISKLSFVNFFNSVTFVSFKSNKSISKNGFSSILLGSSKSVKNLYVIPFVSTANLVSVAVKYLNNCASCLVKSSSTDFASINITGLPSFIIA